MNKNLTPKIILIIVLVALAAWTLYPPNKTLMPGIDLAGGTSLIYEINTFGLEEVEKTDLAQRMIIVLRRRIDPANIQNLAQQPLAKVTGRSAAPDRSDSPYHFQHLSVRNHCGE